MREKEFQFANNADGATDGGNSVSAWIMVLLIGALIICLVFWAANAQVEQVTSGQGKVIPSSQVQVVESLEPGIIAEILISEGDEVDISQPLLRMDDTGLSSRLGELLQKQIALKAELDRLVAEGLLAAEFPVPAWITDKTMRVYDDQLAIFSTNKKLLHQKAMVRKHQLAQRQQSVAEVEANEEKKIESLELMERELKLSEKLFKRKAVTELEILRLRRIVSEMRYDAVIMATTKARLNLEVAELTTLLKSDQTIFLGEVQARTSKVNTELAIVEQSILAARDRLHHAVLRSPVKGIVNSLSVATKGEVVAAGVTIVEIVPIGDKLLIEARIRPQDIGFISPGLPAVIRLSAYDYTKYGTLKGLVERIGVNTITDENNETFYQVIISTNSDDTDNYGKQLRIIPGMIASIDITTGERSILDYLLKPILRISNRALRDPA